MQRLLKIQEMVDKIINMMPNIAGQTVARSHIYGVSAYCMILAKKRKLDIEVCAVAGILHDIKTYQSGDSTDHGPLGALIAREILIESAQFAEAEIKVIAKMIDSHSKKKQIDGKYQELLKDADVLSHYFLRGGNVVAKESHRLKKLLEEFKL